MDKANTINLIYTSYTTDALQQRVPVETARQVFCTVTSVSASEWFDAGRAGLAAEYRATMYAADYQGESTAELNGIRYGIYRTYSKGEKVELYLERKAGV